MKGVVKWFSDQKGYGFLRNENSETDVYVHFSDIKMNGFRTLSANQKVEYNQENTPKGLAAKEVVVY